MSLPPEPLVYLLYKFDVCSFSMTGCTDFQTGHFADFKQLKTDTHFANFEQFKIDNHFVDFGQVKIDPTFSF